MRAHLSLNVKDVEKSVEFYKKVFGVVPQKQTGTYAKFDLRNPSLNFTMQSGGEVSRVSHLGIEVDSPQEVEMWGAKFREQGILEAEEKDVSCCYARQDKVWIRDPDGNHLEVFYVAEQLPLADSTQKVTSCCAGTMCG